MKSIQQQMIPEVAVAQVEPEGVPHEIKLGFNVFLQFQNHSGSR